MLPQMRKTVAALRESQEMQVTCAYYSYGSSAQPLIDEGLKTEDGSTLQWSELGQLAEKQSGLPNWLSRQEHFLDIQNALV